MDRAAFFTQNWGYEISTGSKLGRYEIRGRLGAGGMGEVYRAWDAQLEREVCIKVVSEEFAKDPEALARFRREGKAVASLSHANIRPIYDIGSDAGHTFAVMELLNGETLSGRMQQSSLSRPEIVRISLAVAHGLAAAHEKGIVHRDIKPSNIFLDPHRGIKILDFGLARIRAEELTKVSGDTDTGTLDTQLGAVIGTLTYMSPEQVRARPVDSRSDIFAFGCVLYEMVNGVRPFQGQTNAELLAAILHLPAPPVTSGSLQEMSEIESIIQCCLAKDPDQRYRSGQELASALERVDRASVDPETTTWQPSDTSTEAQDVEPPTASVAVLPFANMSSDKENEYFSDGLAEELINVFTKVKALHVAPRTSAFVFKGRNEDIGKIGRQLHVKTVLQGSVRKAGNRLRIAAQLVDVNDSRHLWSETFDRELDDVFAIQDEIARSITDALAVVLTDQDKIAMRQMPTVDVLAYDYYLQGRQYFHHFRRKSLEFARQMFARAIALDAGYARAYAGLSDCCCYLYLWWDANEDNLKEADVASQRALALDAGLAEARAARGVVLGLMHAFEDARQEFEQAIDLNPKLFEAYYFYARACQSEGRLADAGRLYEQASQIHPHDYAVHSYLASVFLGLKRPEQTEMHDRQTVDLAEKSLAFNPDDARALYLGAIAWCRLGERERGLQWAQRALDMDPDEPVTLYGTTCAYAALGELEEAINCLEMAVNFEKGDKSGFGHKAWIEHDPDFNPLRGHPRFEALLKRL